MSLIKTQSSFANVQRPMDPSRHARHVLSLFPRGFEYVLCIFAFLECRRKEEPKKRPGRIRAKRRNKCKPLPAWMLIVRKPTEMLAGSER